MTKEQAIYTIRVPDIGEGITEVELAAWHVAVGDSVAADQPVADVMTDKATVEIPCHVSGTVLALGGEVGQILAVGADLIRLAVAPGMGNTNTNTSSPVEAAMPAPPAPPAEVDAEEDNPFAARPAASAVEAVVAEPEPVPPPSTSTPTPEQMGLTVGLACSVSTQAQTGLAAPAVRQRAAALGVDLGHIPPSGAAGQITHADLDTWLLAQVRSAGGQGAVDEGQEHIPVVGLRRRIAQKMQEAKRRIPHFSYVEEVDVTALEQLRQQLNTCYASSRGKLSLLPFLARALVLALADFPQINARYDDEAQQITRYRAVHLGVAAQTPAGLMVPVVHHVQSLSLWDCAAAIAQVAAAARSGSARREQLMGSTITISSLGALGGIVSTPVINHPEVAIIAVNRMVQRPVLQDGQWVARQMMNLSSSFDHRVVDGMDAAQFIQAVRALLGAPALLLAA
ncbi:MAG: 2-oxo acid dehydrogenase subunit E2 [Comamonas sp.]|nr:2-oxo acid dehydrogenase subunit E2 [Comamonas sp.]